MTRRLRLAGDWPTTAGVLGGNRRPKKSRFPVQRSREGGGLVHRGEAEREMRGSRGVGK